MQSYCPYCSKLLQVSEDMVPGAVVIGCPACGRARLSESSQWVDCGQGTLDLLTQMATGHASLFPPSGSVQEQTIFTDSRWRWQDAWEWDLKMRKLEAEERRKTEKAEEERRRRADPPVAEPL